jgi:hypothetical protein
VSLARLTEAPSLVITRLDPRSRIISAMACVLTAVSMTRTTGQIGMVLAMDPGTFVEPWPQVEDDQEATSDPAVPTEAEPDTTEQPPEAA